MTKVSTEKVVLTWNSGPEWKGKPISFQFKARTVQLDGVLIGYYALKSNKGSPFVQTYDVNENPLEEFWDISDFEHLNERGNPTTVGSKTQRALDFLVKRHTELPK